MKVAIENNELVIRIPADYLKNSAECALTTGTEKTVMNEQEMLEHYKEKLGSIEDDSHFNRCLDVIADDAHQNGESWLESDLELQHSA